MRRNLLGDIISSFNVVKPSFRSDLWSMLRASHAMHVGDTLGCTSQTRSIKVRLLHAVSFLEVSYIYTYWSRTCRRVQLHLLDPLTSCSPPRQQMSTDTIGRLCRRDRTGGNDREWVSPRPPMRWRRWYRVHIATPRGGQHNEMNEASISYRVTCLYGCARQFSVLYRVLYACRSSAMFSPAKLDQDKRNDYD